MTFISYAQNFEDIRLWRALKYYEKGFYIDVGANHPVDDSVTKAFYDRGWTGINVEPVQEYFDKLSQDRPNDTNLQCVAGEFADDLVFYGIADTGLSTLDPTIAQQHQDAGMDVRTTTVKSRTLTSICEQYAQGRAIHFLKIDVEGHEETVLRGMDFSKYRPWILIIETPWNRDQTWEQLVLDAGYESILFEGLNTFYLAKEHLHLKGAFELPPCNLDDFQFCEGHRFIPRTTVDQQVAAARQRADQAEAQLRAMQNSRAWQAVQKLRKVLRRA